MIQPYLPSTRSILPPSRAARRVACPGSHALEKKYNHNEFSQAVQEGIAAHWLAQYFFKFNNEQSSDLLNLKTPNDEPITIEMIDAVKSYYDKIFKDGLTVKDLFIEQKLSISEIHEDCWGVPDCWGIDHANNTLFIYDFKYGHSFIEAFENWQLIEYAVGILTHIKTIEKISFNIIQPRINNFSTWTITTDNLNFYFKVLKKAEQLALQPEAPCLPNPLCKSCSARHACSALQKAALTAVEIAENNSPEELNNIELGNELRILKQAHMLLDARITGLEAQALNLIKSGKSVTHFKGVPTQTRQRWTQTPEKIINLGLLYGIDLAKPLDVVTPKQAISLGADERVINLYSEKTSGALKLVADNGSDAKKIFGNNN